MFTFLKIAVILVGLGFISYKAYPYGKKAYEWGKKKFKEIKDFFTKKKSRLP